MKPKMQRIGQRFGRLIVVSYHGANLHKQTMWNCLCDCGKTKIICNNNIISGNTRSCGCWETESRGKAQKTHGESEGREYNIWHHIKYRCLNPNSKNYKDYGGRGIKVCDRWLNSFENFLEDMGKMPTPKHTIDRFPNNDGDYEPANCRWGTKTQQNRNRRSSHWVEYNGKRKVLQEWAIELQVSHKAIQYQINKRGESEAIEYFKNKLKYKAA